MKIQFIPIASLSDIETNESIPLAQHDLAKNTYEIFQHSAKQHGEKIALRFLLTGKMDETPFNYSYNELLKQITQSANAFSALGVKNNNVISLLLPNLPQTHFAFWGAQAAGIANPINPLLEPELIIEIMNAVQTTILVTAAPFPKMDLWEKAQIIAQQVPSLKIILTVNFGQFVSEEQEPFIIREAQLQNKNNVTVEDFDHVISQYRGDILEYDRKIKGEDIASYFHTGGTTGAPKVAVLIHQNHVFNAWITSQILQWRPKDVIFCGLPMFHVLAPFVTGLTPFIVGAEVILASPQGFANPTVIANFWNSVEHYKISFFVAVPTIYAALNAEPIQNFNVSSLKFAISAAAPLPKMLIKEFEQRTGLKILEGYGLTETNTTAAVNPPFGERRVGSVGFRTPYQQMKIVQLDENGKFVRDCEIDEIGNVIIKGPNLFKGYLNPKDNEKVWLKEGWFNTGDLGRQDKEGYFWLTGRSKDIIIRSGHNIDPRIIEEVVNHHPAVALAAAIGKPDLKTGELPVAYVTLREGQKITEKALLAFVAEKISERAAIPKNIYILDKMPQTAVGKIFKPALRYDAIQRVFEEALMPIKKQGIHFEIMVTAHPLHGQIVRIKLTKKDSSPELEKQIRTLLAGYSIHLKIDDIY